MTDLARSPNQRERSRLLPAGSLVGALLVLFSVLTAAPSRAVPPSITFSWITPSDGTTLLVARTASNNPLDPPTFQLKADVYLKNSARVPVDVTGVTFTYPGSSIGSWSYVPKWFEDDDQDPETPNVERNWLIGGGAEDYVSIHDGLSRDLSTPLPKAVQIDIYLGTDPAPLTLRFDLAFRDNTVPLGAFFFPAKVDDLDPTERWWWSTRHAFDAGGGVNGKINPSDLWDRYALDMGVVGWNGSIWTRLEGSSTAANEDFRVWDKPLYSMGDGVVVRCYRGEPDEPPAPFEENEFYFGAGNALYIQYGNDRVLYAHLQHDTIPESLCPTPIVPGPGLFPDELPQGGLTIPVETGQFLGRVGNTGRTSEPHLHLEINHLPGTDPVLGPPIQFLNIRALADENLINNLGPNPVLQPLHGMALHRHSMLIPNPCGLDVPDEGLPEVSVHGVPADCYQDVFNLITSRGYRPVFADGYDVDGDTFFNATFRSAGPSSAAFHGLTEPEYDAVFHDLQDDGYRLHQVDSYLDNGAVRYAAIFEQRPGPAWTAFHGLTDAEYADSLDDLSAKGFVPVNISTVAVGGNLQWTGLLEAVPVAGWTVDSVPVADYQDLFNANEVAGRVPIYVHGFDTSSGPHLTGVFVDPIGGNWAAEHGKAFNEYQTAYNLNLGAGRFTRYATGYDEGGEASFAAVWRVRPDTAMTITPPAITNLPVAVFTYEADNPFTTLECRLDGAPFAACAGISTLGPLAEGQHTFETRAVDRELLRDLTPASFTWLVDRTPPRVEVREPEPGSLTENGELRRRGRGTETTVVGWADVVVDAADALAGVSAVTFEVDGVPVPGSPVDEDTWTFVFEPHGRGTQRYVIEATATDAAGNSATAAIEVVGVATGRPRRTGGIGAR